LNKNKASTATPSFTVPAVNAGDVLTSQLTITDDHGATNVAPVNITVQDNSGGNLPPVADAGPDQDLAEGLFVQLDASGSSDPDGSIAGYLWTCIRHRNDSTAHTGAGDYHG